MQFSESDSGSINRGMNHQMGGHVPNGQVQRDPVTGELYADFTFTGTGRVQMGQGVGGVPGPNGVPINSGGAFDPSRYDILRSGSESNGDELNQKSFS